MTTADEEQDHLIRLMAPIHHIPRSAQSPTGDAANELLEDIMRTVESTPRPARRESWFARHRRLVIAVPTVAAIAALAFGVSAVLPSDSGPVGPAPTQALKITREDAFIVIKIQDPAADPERYRTELAKHNLDIELSLAPVGPDRVGKIVFSEIGDTTGGPTLQWVESPGDCAANGNCSVGLRVPVTFKTHAKIVFGRTAKPGEDIDGGSPEQNAIGVGLRGKTVSDALKVLASKGMTATFRVTHESREANAAEVPGTWIVYDTAPLPGNVLALWVSVDGKEPPPAPRSSDGPTPTSVPSQPGR